MENEKVNAFIEPIKVNGEILNYRMYMNYNGIDYCFLNTNQEAANFASYFQRKLPCEIEGATFTDPYGLAGKICKEDSIVGYITGLDNIADSLIGLSGSCTNLDIQADLTVHLNGKAYKIVRNIDDIEDKDSIILPIDGKKVIDFNELLDLDLVIEELNKNENLIDKKRR